MEDSPGFEVGDDSLDRVAYRVYRLVEPFFFCRVLLFRLGSDGGDNAESDVSFVADELPGGDVVE